MGPRKEPCTRPVRAVTDRRALATALVENLSSEVAIWMEGLSHITLQSLVFVSPREVGPAPVEQHGDPNRHEHGCYLPQVSQGRAEEKLTRREHQNHTGKDNPTEQTDTAAFLAACSTATPIDTRMAVTCHKFPRVERRKN